MYVYTIMRFLFLVLFVFFAVGCSSSIPIYKRVVSEDAIREGLIGEYNPKNGEIKRNIEFNDADFQANQFESLLPSVIEKFKSSEHYKVENSKIKKIILDQKIEYIRIELKSCKYFLVNFEIDESGIMGPCNR